MFESANLDRFLRSAQASLGKADYEHAIKVLQEVIEGRTGEFMAEDENSSGENPGPARKPDGEAPAKKSGNPPGRAPKSVVIDEEDPAYSVFSSDDRVYRPVSRLCHELLASMPPEGLGLYRVKYEAAAEKALLAARDLGALEAVYQRHFVTLSAARAMQRAADVLMDSGRFRAAIQTLESLLAVYPAGSRQQAGVDDLLLMLRVAVCYQQLGDLDLARDQLREASQAFPEASVRLMGELHTVKDMPTGVLFDDASQVQPQDQDGARSGALDLLGARELSPLWEYRFAQPAPYRSEKSRATNANRAIRFGAGNRTQVHGTRFPRHRDSIPGTTVRFEGSQLVFLDNFRPCVHELLSGRQMMAMGTAK